MRSSRIRTLFALAAVATAALALTATSASASVITIQSDNFEGMAANGVSSTVAQEALSGWSDVTNYYNATNSPTAPYDQNARVDVAGYNGVDGDGGKGMRVRSSTGAATLDNAMQLTTLGATDVTISFDLKEGTADGTYPLNTSFWLALYYSEDAAFTSPVLLDAYLGLNLGVWQAKSYTITDGVGGVNFTDDAYFMIGRLVKGTGINSTFHSFDNIKIEATVPEPATLALVGLGGLMMLKRRRHA